MPVTVSVFGFVQTMSDIEHSQTTQNDTADKTLVLLPFYLLAHALLIF